MFLLLPASEFVWKKESCEPELETKSEGISHELEMCSYCLAFWLTERLHILYRIKPVFLEEFIIQNPVDNTLQTSVSEVKKKTNQPKTLLLAQH